MRKKGKKQLLTSWRWPGIQSQAMLFSVGVRISQNTSIRRDYSVTITTWDKTALLDNFVEAQTKRGSPCHSQNIKHSAPLSEMNNSYFFTNYSVIVPLVSFLHIRCIGFPILKCCFFPLAASLEQTSASSVLSQVTLPNPKFLNSFLQTLSFWVPGLPRLCIFLHCKEWLTQLVQLEMCSCWSVPERHWHWE